MKENKHMKTNRLKIHFVEPSLRSSRGWGARLARVLLLLVPLLPLAMVTATSAQTTYVATDVGTFGGSITIATGINSSGDVVGYSDKPNVGIRAFLWRNGTMTDLGTLSGTYQSHAFGINDSGTVVGMSDDRPFVYTPGSGMVRLFEPNWYPLELNLAMAINGTGQIVGNGLDYSNNNGDAPGMIVSNGTIQRLAIPDHDSFPQAINASGQAAGYSYDFGFSGRHACLYSGGHVTDLGIFPGGTLSEATGINSSGQIVGFGDTQSGHVHAFIYSAGTMTDLGTLGGPDSNAYGINTAGQVVGSSWSQQFGTTHAFMYTAGGGMVDLNLVTTNLAGFTRLTEARAINASGQIVGYGTFSDGTSHAFLLTPNSGPTPTPTPTPAGGFNVTTLAGLAGSAGSANGTGSAARFNGPYGVAVDTTGNVYVADINNSTIRKITPAGAVSTLAGLAGSPGSTDGTGSAARFNGPSGVAVDTTGNVYVADSYNHTIRKITPAGAVSTLAGLAGSSGSVNGTGSAARFYRPEGVAVDTTGNVYVADTINDTIRKITPAGVVSTLAGLAGSIGSVDGTGSAARFGQPYGVAVDTTGNVYVADTINHTIRKITPAGAVSTLAGLAGSVGSADGTGSAARFNFPYGVTVDTTGNVYVGDTWNHTIRKITPAGAVSTLAGLAGSPGSTDGTGSAARFTLPHGVAVDTTGNVYVADESNCTIRKGEPATPTPRPATLGNISTRLQVGTSDRVMIAGFIVQGSPSATSSGPSGAPKRVLIRAAGPSLTQFGVPNALANPRLELHDTTNTIGMNDNWQTTQIGGVITADQVAEIQNSGLAPSDSAESALIATLAPGSYTAIVQGVNGGTGVGIVEVYDLEANSGSLLANISTRGFVQTEDNVMIGGFIVVAQPTRVIIRAIGPSLTQFGVPDALANPQLELHDTTSTIARNDDWQTTQIGGIITSDQVAEIQNSQLAPTNSAESAIIGTLQPGSYTAIVRGVNNTTGNALVEVYALQ
jgi:probable HAF family extracellular repeat protein